MHDLVFLDIGARGEIPFEWQRFLKLGHSLEIHTFDIEQEMAFKTQERIKYINHACGLWSEETALDYYLCSDAPQSSCYKPNKEIKVFEKKNYETRLVFEKKNIKNISTIDKEFTNQEKIDFIKCDTQGSEMRISQGAENTLRKFCPIVALESWSDYVYEDIPLDFEIKSFYYKIGYKLFHVDPAAGYWKYDTGGKYPRSQGRYMGDNLLFVPSEDLLSNLSDAHLESKILVLSYFRFYDYCYYISKKLGKNNLIKIINSVYKSNENFVSDIYRKSTRLAYHSRKVKNLLFKFKINTTPKIT